MSGINESKKYKKDKYGLDEQNAYNAIKDLKSDSLCSYRSKMEEFFEALGCRCVFKSNSEAKMIMMAMVCRCYDVYEDSFNRAYIALGLMKGYSINEELKERRERYGKVVHLSGESIRKSEDVIFMNIVHQIKKDINAYDNVPDLLNGLREIAIEAKILEVVNDKFRIVFPSLEVQN